MRAPRSASTASTSASRVATDLAETAYVSFAAPDVHGQEPPDIGEDTTPPVVMITIDAITSDSASFSFVANEDGATLETLLAVDGVKGEWEDAACGHQDLHRSGAW